MSFARRGAPENAFHDLSKRSTIFRSKLIEEFQLLDNISNSSAGGRAPTHTSRDIADPKARKLILLEDPYQCIKFQPFKRTQLTDEFALTDRRLTRTRNRRIVPIGAWAGWITHHKWFEGFMLVVIVSNSVMLGVHAELAGTQESYWFLFQFIKIFDDFCLLMFVLEIVLKWMDSFWNFWKDGWNIADFAITVLSAIPELVDLTGTVGSNSSISKILNEMGTLRILRALKMVARFGTLKIIVMTIIQAFQSMAMIMLLVGLVAYMYAVIGIHLYAGSDTPNNTSPFANAFVNVESSMRTLFQLITLDSWDPINRYLATVADPVISQIFVISWVWLGAFIFRNIFVGVMVHNFDKISDKLKSEREEMSRLKKYEKMRRKLNKELEIQGNLQRVGTTTEPIRESGLEHLPKSDQVMQSIQKLLLTNQEISEGWEKTVQETLRAMTAIPTETMWSRDTLFKYFQIMETLQENMREYQELQMMAAWLLMEMHDT
ncbi:Ion transport protein-domain-containing protein [Polychytrium aggregatum]|uniref:Ion transport protein-domain-containing protein n=1 Tax=Polychytrium aggregatum TaxID=110093 RepID=UPI0022FF4527|nr:Ion transport protein-domain-containing protein [Polychytrium aggregatum]KAI9209050.1 Ion transport protein-domain-containing protein [Polychytrium aggregatum]